MPQTLATVETLRRGVSDRFGVDPSLVRVVRSPYRVCPLGAHIDHQLGPVTAMAIDQAVFLAYAPSGDATVTLTSLDFAGDVEFSVDAVPPRRPDDWGNFPRGVALALHDRYGIGRGLVGLTTGKLHGGGVSSSAAVGVAFLLAFEDVNGLEVSREDNIALDRAVENQYLGLRVGILDQSAILLSRRGHLTRVDCRTSAHSLIPAPPGMPPFKILLAFSGLRKALVGTDYNRRVDECTRAAGVLLRASGRGEDEPVLGNVAAEEYAAHRGLLDGPPARRAAHYFSEVTRVGLGVDAWRRGDLARFGALMTESGSSSVVNYECGSPPLIDLYHTLVSADGVFGARFSGAGFRGCCAALVDPDAADRVAAVVTESYARHHPDLAGQASVVICGSDDGAEILP